MPGATARMEKKSRRKGRLMVAQESDRLVVEALTRQAYSRDQHSSLRVTNSSAFIGGPRVVVPYPAQLLNGEFDGSPTLGNVFETSAPSSEKAAGKWYQESCITEKGSDGDDSVGTGQLVGDGACQSMSQTHFREKRQRIEEAVIDEGDETQQPVKKQKLSEEARVWQYVCRRSVFVSPPRPVCFPSPAQLGQMGGQANGVSNLFTGKTTVTEVTIDRKQIRVTVTREGGVVQKWIEQQMATFFGLDVEWQPNRRKGQQDNKVALLQISTETECLLVQMLFLDTIPNALVQFLKDPERKLAGVGIHGDTKKLQRDYGLVSRGEVELTTLAVAHYKNVEFKSVGLKALARHVLGFDMNKSKSVTMSNWSKSILERRQVEYACLDAWVSLAIFGRIQNSPVLAA